MGVSLLDACTFDIRDNLIFERQMSKFKDGDYAGGVGVSQMETREKKLKQKNRSRRADWKGGCPFWIRRRKKPTC